MVSVVKSRWVFGLILLLCSCHTADEHREPDISAPTTGPYVLVLGTAQDAGIPQIGCDQACCARIKDHPEERRLVTSLLVADPIDKKRWLIDASPDLREQVDLAKGHPATRKLAGPRPPLFDGIFLTHAHMGHYTGLMYLGRESYGAKNLPVYATQSMSAFLTKNGPWSLMVETEAIKLEQIQEGRTVKLGNGMSVTPLLVPHRREFSDTCGFIIRGPSKSLFYLPDIDKWEKWSTPIESIIASVDYALLDGTFFAEGEIPGRAMSEIPHPFIEESLSRFATLPASERRKIWFTHLNHTNPAAVPNGPEQRLIESKGMSVAKRGLIFKL